MADRVLFIGWTQPIPGREERALEVFNEAMGLYGRLQEEGRIESFDVALLEPNNGLDGYIQLHGSPEQINALKLDEEFRRVTVDAVLAVDGVRLIEGFTNAAVAREMARYQEAVAKVPQSA
jgi:hypothetical protein